MPLPENEPKRIPNPIKFAFGGLAGMGGTMFVQPLDLVKNRMQVGNYRHVGHCVKSILAGQTLMSGISTVYTGLGAGLLRQATYTTTRIGIFTTLMDARRSNTGKDVEFKFKAGFGMIAGMMGSIVGNPSEVCLIRMTADGNMPVAERRGYTSVGNALVRIVREEGVLTLWRGCAPTIGRAVVINCAQLASYSQFKEEIKRRLEYTEGIKLHFTASMCSGMVSTIISMPIDIIKSRTQNMRVINGVPEYRGAIHCFTHLIRNEGPLALWSGFMPYYFRLGPHTVLTFMILEQLNAAYRRST